MILALPGPPTTTAVATKDTVILLSDTGEETRRIPLAASRLVWSPDGKTLAVLARDRRLLTVVAGAEPVLVADEASEPCWSRDGRILFAQGSKGIAAARPGEAPILLVPTAHSPAPSPDGERLAFALDGTQGGVWTAAADGSSARRLMKGSRVGGVSWSYDGRWVASVLDGHVRLVRANGLSSRDLGPVAGATALWSDGAAELLTRRGDAWSVYDALAEGWTDVAFDAVPTPRWTGPRRLTGIRNGAAVEVTLGAAPLILSKEAAVDVARVVGTYRGASFPDRFRAAPRPDRGVVAWRGAVVSSDPVDGLLTLKVEAEVDARGRETEFGRPALRRAKVPVGELSRRLAVLPETEAWLLVAGGRVVDAYLPDAPTTGGTPAPNGRPLRRPARVVEYDGVCRERVIVPMVYPIPGKHRLVDTFLADRDGGARRHHGNDLMAPKMTPLLAVFDGVVSFGRTSYPGAQNTLYLRGDDGYTAHYLHINNDTPGTDDGLGSMRYAFPADLQSGDRVRAGQVVAYCGDSGNAENVGAHLHFELHDGEGGGVLDPFFSLKAAQRLASPRYADPDPVLSARVGEARWDGVVSAVDAARRVVGLELTAIAKPNAPPARCPKPRLVYLSLAPGRVVRYRGESDLAYPLDSVRPGVRLSAVGAASGSKMSVRAASMALAGG